MHPRLFFDHVVRPNAEELLGKARLRPAVNSILSIDAFYGVLFAHLHRAGHPRVAALTSDDKLKDEIAAASPAFRIVRDTAFSLKHGELTHPKPGQPRLVTRAADLGAKQLDGFYWGVSHWGLDHWDGNETVSVQIAGAPDKRAEPLIQQCVAEAAALLASLGL